MWRIDDRLEDADVLGNLQALRFAESGILGIARSAMQATRPTVNNPAPLTEMAIAAILRREPARNRSWWSLEGAAAPVRPE